MRSLTQAGVPVASSCGGFGICGKCRLEVVSNPEHLSKESDLETGIKMRDRIAKEFRISCQTKVLGDVTVDTRYW